MTCIVKAKKARHVRKTDSRVEARSGEQGWKLGGLCCLNKGRASLEVMRSCGRVLSR